MECVWGYDNVRIYSVCVCGIKVLTVALDVCAGVAWSVCGDMIVGGYIVCVCVELRY